MIIPFWEIGPPEGEWRSIGKACGDLYQIKNILTIIMGEYNSFLQIFAQSYAPSSVLETRVHTIEIIGTVCIRQSLQLRDVEYMANLSLVILVQVP